MMADPIVTRLDSVIPAVEVFFPDFPAGTSSVTVFRLTDAEHQVRGAVNRIVAGELSVVDWEAPFGITVTYRAECFDGAGLSLGYTTSATYQLNESGLWVHNPLDPQGAVRCDFRSRALREISMPAEGDMLWTGDRVGVFFAGTQQGRTADLSIAVDTVADREKFNVMLGRGAKSLPPILCFRFGADHRVSLPRPFYAATPAYVESDLNVIYGGGTTHFNGEGYETLPPAPGLFVPLLTYGDLNAAYATYGDLKADNLTYGDVNRRYDLALGE